MSKLFRSLSRRLSFSSPSPSSTSPIHSSSNPLTEKVARPDELSPKHNIFEEEVCFEDINQAIDNWEIPKIPQDELYIPDDNKRKSGYIIKTAENNIPLGPNSGEEFHLLTKQSVREHARHYRYLHIGCVQVAVKPLIREGLNASILMCLRDIRHNDFQDSLIGTVETSLGHGPVYFNCFPNKTVSLLDTNILDSLFLNIRIHGLNMKEGSIPAALIYRIQYKVMNTCNSRVLLKTQDRETTLFVTDMTKANVMIPRLIRSEAGTSNDFASARRSFSVTSQSQFSKCSKPVHSEINISGLQNNSNISQAVYQTDDKHSDDDIEIESSIQSPTYSSMQEVIQKIDQLLNCFSTVPETPNSGESTSRIQTRSSKAVNALCHESNDSSSEQSDDSHKSSLKISPILTNSLTKWKGLTKPSAYGYNRVSAPDLALEERELGFVSFNSNVYEWNIDGKTEYNIMSMLQHMTMVGTAYQAAHETSEEAIANVIVFGFSGQLKGWWDNYLSDNQKHSIFSAIKVNDQNEPIIGDDGEPIPDAVNTLIFTIASHFIGDPSLWKDRSAELLSNLRCKTLSDFRWYKDTFLTRVYTREDSQQPFWKEKFLAGLPKSLGDKVRDKIRSLIPDGIIPYDELSYGQLVSFIQKVALKICQDDKIQRQLAREKNQNRIDLGTFCEQFGLPACHPRKSKRPSN
ncbi:polyprotein [Arachis hypogaea]|nr:polyprotein [Arachis hypogaea]